MQKPVGYTVKFISDTNKNNFQVFLGNDCEWNGSWSDKSRMWDSIPNSMKRELGFVRENDGEFW